MANRPNLLDISRFSSVIGAAAAQSATLRCAAAATDAVSESTGTTFANNYLKDTWTKLTNYLYINLSLLGQFANL